MSRIKRADLMEVQRYVDGELSPDRRAHFEARLGEEAALRAAVEAARDQRRLFQDDPAGQLPPKPLDVADAVMDRVRGLPRRDQLMQVVEGDELADAVAATARGWLLAAAVLVVAALLFGARLIRPSGGEAHARDQVELERLDEIYRELQERGEGLPARSNR